MIKVNAKNILAALPHISTDDTRYYLCGVFFEQHPEGVAVVSTDGHTMFAALDKEGQADESQIMPISKELATACKSKRDDFGDRYVFFNDGQWKVATLAEDTDGNEQIMPQAIGFADPIDGTFPDWRRVAPSGDVDQSEWFNPALLVKFQKSAKALDCGQIAITQHGTGPALISFYANSQCFGALMPMRGEHAEDVTSWINERGAVPLAAE
jgi:hypothetical protein